jgi:hypothetical protein
LFISNRRVFVNDILDFRGVASSSTQVDAVQGPAVQQGQPTAFDAVGRGLRAARYVRMSTIRNTQPKTRQT